MTPLASRACDLCPRPRELHRSSCPTLSGEAVRFTRRSEGLLRLVSRTGGKHSSLSIVPLSRGTTLRGLHPAVLDPHVSPQLPLRLLLHAAAWPVQACDADVNRPTSPLGAVVVASLTSAASALRTGFRLGARGPIRSDFESNSMPLLSWTSCIDCAPIGDWKTRYQSSVPGWDCRVFRIQRNLRRVPPGPGWRRSGSREAPDLSGSRRRTWPSSCAGPLQKPRPDPPGRARSRR